MNIIQNPPDSTRYEYNKFLEEASKKYKSSNVSTYYNSYKIKYKDTNFELNEPYADQLGEIIQYEKPKNKYIQLHD